MPYVLDGLIGLVGDDAPDHACVLELARRCDAAAIEHTVPSRDSEAAGVRSLYYTAVYTNLVRYLGGRYEVCTAGRFLERKDVVRISLLAIGRAFPCTSHS